MASYHRVLSTYDRSVDDKTKECDLDIHPWNILVDGERWAGKIRLIGFVDVLFLICYSGESRFNHGLIIYSESGIVTEIKVSLLIHGRVEDDDAIRNTLNRAKVEAEDIDLKVINPQGVKEGKEPCKYFRFSSENGDSHYNITSLGHPIGLGTEIPRSRLKRHSIKLRKGATRSVNRHLRRGIMQHDLFDLMHDAVRLSIVTHAELLGLIMRGSMGGSTVDDVSGKFLNTLLGNRSGPSPALSGAGQQQ